MQHLRMAVDCALSLDLMPSLISVPIMSMQGAVVDGGKNGITRYAARESVTAYTHHLLAQ
jgi:hypothetical protein